MEETGSGKPSTGGHATDDKTTIAGGIAIAIVAILFVGWAILFFKKAARGSITPTLDFEAQEQFNLRAIQDSQSALFENYNATVDEFRALQRETGGGTEEVQVYTVEPEGRDEDPFGSSAD